MPPPIQPPESDARLPHPDFRQSPERGMPMFVPFAEALESGMVRRSETPQGNGSSADSSRL
jgi:hypothetical protein